MPMPTQMLVQDTMEEPASKVMKKVDISDVDMEKGSIIIEGKTKIVYELPKAPGKCLVLSKDSITAYNGVMKNTLEGKASISTKTTCATFSILENAGIKTSLIQKVDDKSFLAHRCSMIPIEWVTRRVATGSFLRRNEGVKEGYRFNPPKLEIFYKDDAKDDPQWSREMLEESKLKCGNLVITADEIDKMEKMTVAIFEILERCWQTKNVSLIDMKIEFGVCSDTNEIILADVIDNDSWRIWQNGDKRLMMDKQVYRNLRGTEITDVEMQNLKQNFTWVADTCHQMAEEFRNSLEISKGQVVVLMGSASDKSHCEKILNTCDKLAVKCILRVTSAHKGTEETLKILSKLEGESLHIPTVIIAVAGRSNGLGPVMAGNSCLPVINCPPVSAQWATSDIWSSLRLPSGLGCATIIDPEMAAQAAAQILAQHDVVVWSKLRVQLFSNWLKLKKADMEMRREMQRE
uniref:multifunctional protein ADE2-like n=1 Tax=Styela clava TaxID=7725 RepID=UPI00193A05C6|nr:multifunctional protein ADE2-like [Styela clava]